MSHDEYIKRRDEILESLQAQTIDEYVSDKPDYGEPVLTAQQAIDELVLAVIGEGLDRYEQRALIDDTAITNANAHDALRSSQRSIVKGDI